MADSILVWDNGPFVHVAERLGREDRKVGYFAPWIWFNPSIAPLSIGKGYPNVEREAFAWDVVDKYDVICFPDLGDHDAQLQLVKMGKLVWGSRTGDWLELDRWRLKEYLRSVDLPVSRTTAGTGTAWLRAELKQRPNTWVKVSVFRQDLESFHNQHAAVTDVWLDELEHNLGPMKRHMEFMVEDNIPAKVEIGYDGFSIDGQFPEYAAFGVEAKDEMYIGKVVHRDETPKILAAINDTLSAPLAEARYRNWLSTEIRITESGKAYLQDPCQRLASPPGEAMLEMFDNWGDIIANGARGKMIKPNPVGKYIAMLMLYAAWIDAQWHSISFPPELTQWVKLRNGAVIDGRYYVISEKKGYHKIGGVVAFGDTLRDAIDLCKKRAEQVSGYELVCFPDSLDQADEIVKNCKDVGIEW